MEFSLFGQKMTRKSGILELMDDLGRALSSSEKAYMLGGGNPAHIPAVNKVWRRCLTEILAEKGQMEIMLANYDTPQGRLSFLGALSELLSRNFGWNLTEKNIATTTGSQNAFFILFNLLAGPFSGGRQKKILFPLAPEYIGYADQALGSDHFISHRPRVEILEAPFFKYFVDFETLKIPNNIGALCASRPTNPTGNVLTDEEVHRLSDLAKAKGIPFLLDNAYGSPFPHILFEEITPYWDENTILVLSLSKLGLPAVRTGIIVARPEIIEAVSSVNAILNLAGSGIGPMITEPLIKSGEILDLGRKFIAPFYRERRDQTVEKMKSVFGDRFPWKLHKPEGSLFLWLWLPNLAIPVKELYQRLKDRRVIVVPGHYFFFGEDSPQDHQDKCLRINYSQNPEDVAMGLEIMAEEIEKAQNP